MVIRRLLLAFAVLPLLLITFALPTPTTYAAPKPPTTTPTVVSVPMEVDCARTPDTPEAQEFLKDNQLCKYAPKSKGVQAQNSITGKCGNASLYIFADGGGYMQWKLEVTSSGYSPIVYVNYYGTFRNRTTGRSGAFSNSYATLTYDSVDVGRAYSDAGEVSASIAPGQLQTTLATSVVCYSTSTLFDTKQIT